MRILQVVAVASFFLSPFNGLAHAQAVGERCVLEQAAKLFLGQSGAAFSLKLKSGSAVTLETAHGTRWLVAASEGQIGYLEASWMKKVCRYEKVPAPAEPQAKVIRDVPNLDVGDLVETSAALEVTKLAALGEGQVSRELIRAQVAKVAMVREESRRADEALGCDDRSGDYRVAVYDFETSNIPDGMARVISNSLLTEIRKLEGISAIGMDEIREMLDFESQRQAMGCDANQACMAQIAGALGVDEVVTGRLSEEANGRMLTLRRIDQRRAEVVGSIDRRLAIGDGEEFLLAIGPAVEGIYPERNNRPGTERGVPEKVLLRLNPPPISPMTTLSTIGVSVAALVLGGAYAYRGQEQAEFYNSGAGMEPGRYESTQLDTFRTTQESAQSYVALGNVGLITGGVLAIGSTVMSLFTDWEILGDEASEAE
jgi:hypothetical protein